MNLLCFQTVSGELEFAARRVVIAGFTGRNVEQARAHLSELEQQGIPCPSQIPAFYELHAGWLTQAESVPGVPGTASGEVEAVLIFRSDDLQDALVAVGSDLTDRKVEKRAIGEAKMLPKPISRSAWLYRDHADEWDCIVLRSWVGPSGSDTVYQNGSLSELLTPERLVHELRDRINVALAGTVLFMGTVPLVNGAFSFVPQFRAELRAPNAATLFLEYTARP